MQILIYMAIEMRGPASSDVIDELRAYRLLNEVVSTFGAPRIVSWVAEIVEQRSDAFLNAAEHRKAAEAMRVFRILQAAAVRLKED